MDNERACPTCGKQISSNASFCPYCGHKVEPAPPAETLCPNCGTKLGPDAKFCTNCGTRLADEKQSVPEEPVQNQNEADEANENQNTAEQMNENQAAADETQRNQNEAEKNQQASGAPDQSEKKTYAYGQSGQNQQNQQYQSNYSQQAAEGEPRYVGFGEAIKLFFKNYVNFTGRASRSEFWWSVLLVAILSGIFTFIPFVGIILKILLWIPSLSITIRRMHDINKMWTWILMGLIPFVGWIIMIVFCVRKSVGDNKWGPVYRDGE